MRKANKINKIDKINRINKIIKINRISKIDISKIKLKCLEKIGSGWFFYNKCQIISTIYKLFEYNFRWN